ncbi:hypothetical protein OBBRIDRAFT_836101 [Obba rivulosa]|uniref:Fungal-type protein kinase domain-containing protein n=1 Tax=Obba rivulosa TaxID=1052685 RepID=A0A8E2AQF9_9APHY|nr:hypothetical protein OBBRIDRAFT_836101 [Obba rivulosa]
MASVDSLDTDLSRSIHIESTRTTFVVELKWNIEWDDPSLFVPGRSGIGAVGNGFIVKSRNLVEEHPALTSQLRSLVKKIRKSESDIYDYFSLIFKLTELPEDRSGNSQIRIAKSCHAQSITVSSDLWGNPTSRLDFSMVNEGLVYNSGNRRRNRITWRKVESKASDGPLPDETTDMQGIRIRSADCPRLYISSRSFQLSVGFLFHNDEFSAGIYRHALARFSHSCNVRASLDQFIRMVRCITTHTTLQQLACQDDAVTRSVAVQRKEWFTTLRANTNHGRAQDCPVYESHQGGMIGTLGSEVQWTTVGSPIWTTLSPSGRSTLGWQIRNKRTFDVMIVKVAWHNGARLPKSSICERAQGVHPGATHADPATDLVFPRGNGAVSYRISMFPIGRSLCKARTELELIKGIRAALRDYELLSNQGILHRDISVGSIMLSSDDNPQEGAEGFLMDFEFDLYTDIQIENRTLNHARIPTEQVLGDVEVEHFYYDSAVIRRDAPKAGTLQFMAADLLLSLSENLNDKREVTSSIEHKPHHDIESFLWVFIYSLFRRLLYSDHQDDQKKEWMNDLKFQLYRFFGRETADLIRQRTDRKPWRVVEEYPNFFSGPMKDLIEKLRRQFILRHYHPLTHAAVLDAFDIAIRRLSQPDT